MNENAITEATATPTAEDELAAAVMLCHSLNDHPSETPLSPSEFHQLRIVLADLNLSIGDLVAYSENAVNGLKQYPLEPTLVARIQALVSRGFLYTTRTMRWQQLGATATCYSHDGYPAALASLNDAAPPVCHTFGDPAPLHDPAGNVAIITTFGPTRQSQAIIETTAAKFAASNRRVSLSIDTAHGDQIAQRTIELGGSVLALANVEPAADRALERHHRNAIMTGQLTIWTDGEPDRTNTRHYQSQYALIQATAYRCLKLTSSPRPALVAA